MWDILRRLKDITFISFLKIVFVARNDTFLEREFISKSTSGSKFELEEIQDKQRNAELSEIFEEVQPISQLIVVNELEPESIPESS